MRTIQVQIRRTPQRPSTGQYVQAVGVRVGYWPCVKGYFLQAVAGSHQFEIYYGLRPEDKLS